MSMPVWDGITIDYSLLNNYGWFNTKIVVDGQTYPLLEGYQVAGLSEMNILIAQGGGSSTSAAASAAAAASSASLAAGSATTASGFATAASGSATSAGTSASAAAASAASAASAATVAAAAALQATSTSTVTPAAGAISYTTQSGKGFTDGQKLIATDHSSPTTIYAIFTVTSYSGTTLSGTVAAGDSAGGSSSLWDISVTGKTGATGAPPGLTPVSRSSNTALASADNGKAFLLTGAFTQTAVAAATLGAGWWVWIKNNNTASGTIVFDPNGSETIDGHTTINIYPGESFIIGSDGANLFTVGREGAGSKVLISSVNPGAVASVDITVPADAEFDTLNLSFNTLDTTGSLRMRLQTSSTVITGAVYAGSIFTITSGPTSAVVDSGSATSFSLSTNTGAPMSGEIVFPAYQVVGNARLWFGTVTYQSTGNGGVAGGNISGDTNGTQALTLIRLLNSGTLGGTVRLYGIRK